MDVETLWDARRANWSLSAQCLGRDASTKKGTRPCPMKIDLDLSTLVWTRGRDFPLTLLSERLRCPACGCRRMMVYFNKPGTTGFAMMGG
jgi:hypothetical protein